MRILPFLILSMLVACKQEKKNSLLTTEALPKQVYRINNTKDTVLKTANGALLTIAKGSFRGGGVEVELVVKEAYSMEDIVKAGLTTQTDGQPLKSGGMIFVDAPDESVEVEKPIGISIPAETFDEEMKVFKGEENEGGINWASPAPLLDTVPQLVKNGQAIFDASCATCHALDKNLTGPALRGVENRGPWNDRNLLFDFTRNPAAFIPTSSYAQCLVSVYNGQLMPSFPQLSDESLTAIYDYIKYGDNSPVNNDPCRDSCRRYDSAMYAISTIKNQRQKLIVDNGFMTEVRYDSNARQTVPQINVTAEEKDLVMMENNFAEYYKFSIDAFGWYNVDALLKDDERLKESKLTVLLEGEQKKHVDIYLVVPSIKVFTLAGRTDNPDEFAFYTKDGKLSLPQGSTAYILAMSENADGVLFSQQKFTITPSQQIRIGVKPSSKEEIATIFKSSGFSDVKIAVQETKNASEIRQLDKDLKATKANADLLKPTNCDCSCDQTLPSGIKISADTTVTK